MGRKNSKKRKKEKHHSSNHNTVKGTLEVTRSGMGYVIVDDVQKDVLIRQNNLNCALNGDKVRVRITKVSFSGGRSEGVITDVIERKQTEFIGKLDVKKTFAFFLPDSEKKMPDFYIPLSKLNGAKNGERVVARLLKWNKDQKPEGEVVSILDASNENDMAMKEILTENGFPLTFSEDTIEECERISEIIPKEEIKNRRDFRDVLTFTIDPVDAKDFDDAISFERLSNGHYEIGVHIADVSYYMQPETSLDKDAYEKATSVYLPDRVLPMLPERLSNELCSLRPNEDKLTFAAVFEITPKGEIKKHWLGRTVIHSDHRFTYEDVQEIIENKRGLFAEEVLLLNDLAQHFRKKRFKKGAINFSSQEVRFKLDKDAKPIGIVVKESKEAHQLIEEFMLLANKKVAEDVAKVKVKSKVVPFPYRVHDQPDPDKLAPFSEFARKFGHRFDLNDPDSIAASFNKMLEEVKGKPEQHVLEQLGIRTMAKAIYTAENIGHYGLSFEHYCHFTSPIRRYPDVMVHRILDSILRGQPEIDKKLEEKCKHCSERERAAMDSERAANKYKQVEYLKDYIGDEFEGVISGVASFGFWVETIEHKCEGLVTVMSLLEYDDFRHNEEDYCLVGRRSGRQFRIGDRVWIKVISANLGRRQLDYEWVIAPSEKKETQEEKPKSKKKK